MLFVNELVKWSKKNSDPICQNFSKSLSDLFLKMTHFLFLLVFFLSFSTFPPFETVGMSPLPWHLSARDRFDFFFFFCHYRHLKWRDWIVIIFFVFLGNICTIKTQIIINKNMININLWGQSRMEILRML